MKALSTAALALAFALPLAGCFETIAGPYEGPDQVGFAQELNGSYARAVNSVAASVPLTVELISSSGTLSGDVTVPVIVDPAGTTAVEGQDYTFPNGSQVTIPAGSVTGTFTINTLPRPAGTAARTLKIELGSSADGAVTGAENFDDFTVTMRAVAP